MRGNIVAARQLFILAEELLAESDYVHDPTHRHRPHDGQNWNRTPKGWSTFRKSRNEELKRQCDKVMKSTIGTPIWMKAPNGEQTKLTEEQWIYVHTPSFKERFGEWELAALLKNVRKTWEDESHDFTFRFAPSERLRKGLESILKHDITSLMITGSDVIHTKRDHSKNEEKRGQIDIVPEDFVMIPYLLNNYDTMRRSTKHDKMHHGKLDQAVEVRKRINGVAVIATIEKGKRNQGFVSLWIKKKATPVPMPKNDLSPEPNVQDAGGLHSNIKHEVEKIKSSAKNFSKIVDRNGEPIIINTKNGWKVLNKYV